MKQLLISAVCISVLSSVMPLPLEAAPGTINRACRSSDRPNATRQLCGCIQRVANQTLSQSERRTVAKWFADPHRAQEVKMSDRGSDERLWQRYKAFGQLAQAACN
ncbi:MAG: hypothetical protein AAF408_07305 [Pseudomonadota bacterium]